MIKYIKYFFGFILLCSQVIAMNEGSTMEMEGTKILGKSAHFTFRSIADGDAPMINEIASQCTYKEGLPGTPTTWAQNLIKRQETVRSYSGLLLESTDGNGFLGFGRMTTVDYDSKFVDIIETYLSFGITRLIAPEAEDKYAKGNIARVDNNGLGFILPILPESLGEESRQEALKIGVEAFQLLKNNGHTLPVEKTVPTHLIGLFHPDDSLIPLLESVGFDIIRKEGFFGYYDKPRVIAHIELK